VGLRSFFWCNSGGTAGIILCRTAGVKLLEKIINLQFYWFGQMSLTDKNTELDKGLQYKNERPSAAGVEQCALQA